MKPGGGFFLADPHYGGQATRVRLLEAGWGRLVAVHDVDANGEPNPIPVLRDVVIGENVLSDGDLVLETSPITHESRLIVLRTRDSPDAGQGTFASILARATGAMSAILPRNDDGSELPPLSYVARNATLVLRFEDLLADGPEEREALLETVRLTSGYPPVTPQPARIVFDPSHGGLAHGVFHSTRVLLDFSVSAREALELPTFVPINAAGLPASSLLSEQANASLHLPTRLEESVGRFTRLTNLAGRGIELEGPSEPVTRDLVRAFRSGNNADVNSGFLLDLSPPRLIGTWDATIEGAREDPLGPAGHGFVVDLAFRTLCRSAPRRADTLEIAGELYEVREPGAAPGFDGRSRDLRVLRLAAQPLATADSLLGLARLSTPFRREDSLHSACWVTFVPPPRDPPFEGVESDVRVSVRFSEPMNPDSFRAFDSLRVLRGSGTNPEIGAEDLVVGAVRVEQDLQEFSFVPRLPFANQGSGDYRIELIGGTQGVSDLSGTPLAGTFGLAPFTLALDQAPQSNSGFALRFQSRDELDPTGLPDLRGQVIYDEEGGVLRPRLTAFGTFAADRGNPLPNLMAPFPFGVQTPLSSMGSKLQAIWRYCDFGFRVRDESFHNLDVIGLSWSPLGGALIADFFPLFELRLAHSRYVPDETGTGGTGPIYPDSGLRGGPFEFVHNLLEDPRGEQAIVHPRGLGYRVRPVDMTVSGLGTPFLPFPWNHAGAPLITFTWRDTAVLAKAGFSSPGVPLDIEVGPPLRLDEGVGQAGPPGRVPSIGLPLLWEVRCFPSSRALGFNSLDILLPFPGFPTPNFRAFSTGGFDQTGRAVTVDPDLELRPNGGFNPNSNPPGMRTPFSADNSFYVGQIDTVVRVSRAVSIWIPIASFSPRFVEPVIEPRSQIGASAIVIEYRGADSFSDALDAPFDATQLDPYGDFAPGSVNFHGDGTWKQDIRELDGALNLQVRFTFLNDIQNRLSPELDSFGVAYRD